MLAEKLNMSADEAEKWIANLIRNDKQLKQWDAKIDSKEVGVKSHRDLSLSFIFVFLSSID